MKAMMIILMGAILTDNFVLVRFLGICPFLGVSNKLDSATGMGIAVTVVMAVSTAITWPIQTYLLDPYGFGYLQTLVFILLIASVVQVMETFMKKHMKGLYSALGVYLPLITTNCAVLGVTILNIDEGYTFAQSMVNAIGGGIGFLLAMVIFAGVRGRLDMRAEASKSFKGIPITLVSAAIVSLAFMGFGGVAEGIFG